jgi:hypothetical protein
VIRTVGPARRLGLALAMLALPLGGCAAALVPVIAGGLVAKQQTDRHSDAAQKAEVLAGGKGEATAGEEIAPPVSSIAEPSAISQVPAKSVAPAPAAVIGGDPFAAFARFAIERGAAAPPGQVRRSALIEQDSLTTAQPRLADCADQPPAVVIDLDLGPAPFDLTDPPLPAPGLAVQLAAIRAASVTVLWSASVPVDGAQKLYTILGASGLDPDRTDRLLLLKLADNQSKQLRRTAAARDWCIVAIAGDRQSDFDEVFDFLRDPNGPIARALAPNLGAGWFLTPPPID